MATSSGSVEKPAFIGDYNLSFKAPEGKEFDTIRKTSISLRMLKFDINKNTLKEFRTKVNIPAKLSFSTDGVSVIPSGLEEGMEIKILFAILDPNADTLESTGSHPRPLAIPLVDTSAPPEQVAVDMKELKAEMVSEQTKAYAAENKKFVEDVSKVTGEIKSSLDKPKDAKDYQTSGPGATDAQKALKVDSFSLDTAKCEDLLKRGTSYYGYKAVPDPLKGEWIIKTSDEQGWMLRPVGDKPHLKSELYSTILPLTGDLETNGIYRKPPKSSGVNVVETQNSVQNSMLKQGFHSAAVEAKFPVPIASALAVGVNVGFSRSTSKKKEETEEYSTLTATYQLPQVNFAFNLDMLTLTPKARAAAVAVRTEKEVNEFLDKFGVFFVLRWDLGGELISQQTVKVKKKIQVEASKNEFSAMAKASVAGSAGGGAGGSTGSSKTKTSSSTDLSKNIKWTASGGDETMFSEPNQWKNSVLGTDTWKPLNKYDNKETMCILSHVALPIYVHLRYPNPNGFTAEPSQGGVLKDSNIRKQVEDLATFAFMSSPSDINANEIRSLFARAVREVYENEKSKLQAEHAKYVEFLNDLNKLTAQDLEVEIERVRDAAPDLKVPNKKEKNKGSHWTDGLKKGIASQIETRLRREIELLASSVLGDFNKSWTNITPRQKRRFTIWAVVSQHVHLLP